MSDNLISPNKEFSNNAHIKSIGQYQDLYNKSIWALLSFKQGT